MSSTDAMEELVKVEVTTVSDGEMFRFSGSGVLERTESSLLLRYELPEDGGRVSRFSVRLAGQRALIRGQNYRLLLDSAHPTAMTLAEGVAHLRVTVVTHCIKAETKAHGGTIYFHYSLFPVPTPTPSDPPLDMESTLTFYPQGETV